MRLAALVALLALHAGAAKVKTEARMEWSGQQGGRLTPGQGEVVDKKGWRALWRELGRDAPPAPDFSRWIAVIVHLGEKPTGGYTAEFLEPKRDHDDLIVRYRVQEPGGMATQAFTRPWKLRLFEKPPGSVIVKGGE